MNLVNKTTRISLLAALLLLAACSASSTPSTAGKANGTDTKDKGGGTQAAREALSFVAPCNASACGDVPASSTSATPQCASTSGTCSWSASAGDDSVSYSGCDDALCGAKPDASVCPAGTTFKGAACGSEDDGACIWRSACGVAPSTTLCPDPEGCGGKPEIGVVCKDGSVGDLLCRSQGAKCGWERSCE